MSTVAPTAVRTNEERIRERLDRGGYADAAEVVRKALDALDHEENLALVRRLLEEGRESARQHGTIPWTPTMMDEILEEALEANRRGDPIPDYMKR